MEETILSRESTTNPQAKSRVFSLDLIRALAVSLVVLSHFSVNLALLFNIKETRFYDSIFNYLAMLGINLFFVLSGFLIGGILIDKFNKQDNFTIKNIKSFWIRRWFRTLPNYYLVLILLTAYCLLTQEGVYSPKEIALTYVFLSHFVTTPSTFFSLAWTLAIEEWFYFTFPLALLFFSRFKTSKIKTLFIAVLSFIFITLVFRAIMNVSNPNLSWQYVTFLRMDSIAIGILAATVFFYKREFWEKNKTKFFIIGSLIFIICSEIFLSQIFYKQESLLIKLFYDTSFSLALSLFFPLLYGLKSPKYKIFEKAVTSVSLFSYSIYLTSLYIILLFNSLISSISLRIILSIISIISAGYIQYRYFEKPMMDLREKFN